eukprot:1999724-Amphidinium_carterae.1
MQVVLLWKKVTDTRPIGLLAALWRLWGRLPHARAWGQQHELPAHWGGRHRDCEVHSWRQGLSQEVAFAMRQHMGSVMVDVTKAFENVRHDVLQESAKEYKFPQQILGMALAIYIYIYIYIDPSGRCTGVA